MTQKKEAIEVLHPFIEVGERVFKTVNKFKYMTYSREMKSIIGRNKKM